MYVSKHSSMGLSVVDNICLPQTTLWRTRDMPRYLKWVFVSNRIHTWKWVELEKYKKALKILNMVHFFFFFGWRFVPLLLRLQRFAKQHILVSCIKNVNTVSLCWHILDKGNRLYPLRPSLRWTWNGNRGEKITSIKIKFQITYRENTGGIYRYLF